MSPRADFACLSKLCATKKGAKVYELPVTATHCPHGHKRLRRLFNAINVATRGVAKHVDRLAGPEYMRQKSNKDQALASATAASHNGHPAVVAGFARNMGPLLAKATSMPSFAAASAGPDKPAERGASYTAGVFGKVKTLPRPSPDSKRWSG
jgi:hypothetical protein